MEDNQTQLMETLYLIASAKLMLFCEYVIYIPSHFCQENLFKFLPHEAVDEEVRWAVDYEEPVHEAGKTQEPGWRLPVVAGTVAPADDQLRHVDDESGGVTQKEHDHDADQHCRQVHFVMRRAVAIWRADVGISKME